MRLQSSSPKYNVGSFNDLDLAISQKHAEIEQLLEEVTQKELELAQIEAKLIKAIQDEIWLQESRGGHTPSDPSSGHGGDPNFIMSGHFRFETRRTI